MCCGCVRRWRGTGSPGARHRHVEESPLVVVVPFVSRCVEYSPWNQPVALTAVAARRKPAGGERRHEDDRPLQALGLVDREEVDCVEIDIVLALEGLVCAASPILHIARQPLVVLAAAIPGASLLARGVGVGARSPARGLVVGEKLRAASQGAQPIHRQVVV